MRAGTLVRILLCIATALRCPLEIFFFFTRQSLHVATCIRSAACIIVQDGPFFFFFRSFPSASCGRQVLARYAKTHQKSAHGAACGHACTAVWAARVWQGGALVKLGWRSWAGRVSALQTAWRAVGDEGVRSGLETLQGGQAETRSDSDAREEGFLRVDWVVVRCFCAGVSGWMMVMASISRRREIGCVAGRRRRCPSSFLSIL